MPDFIKTPIKSIIDFINTMIAAVESGINGVIKALNHVSVDIPETPFSDAFKIGFDLSNVSLPRIPQLSKGGVLKKGQIGFLEGDGSEAVVPLEKNTKWISRVASTMSDEFGKYRLNTYVPKQNLSSNSYNYEKLKSTMQMEMDARMAQQQYELRQQNKLLQEQNELLRGIYNKPTLSDDDVFNATRRGQSRFQRRTFRTGWAGVD